MEIVTDPEVLDFIARTEAAFPADANVASPAERRRQYDTMCALFRAPRPAGVEVADSLAGGVATRRYFPVAEVAARPFLLYCHGGGFVVGSLDSHDDICAEIAVRARLEVVAVDYRRAPEHVYPAPLDDVTVAWLALADSGRAGLVAGDSAGGGLAAALCLRMRRLRAAMPVGQVVIYPSLGGDGTAASYRENADAPLLRTSDLAHYTRYHGGAAEACDPELFPLRATDFSGLPPALVVTADVDPLRDDGPAYAAALRAAGGRAHWRNEPQLVHGYLRARHVSRRAARSFQAICDWIARAADPTPAARRARRASGTKV
jgi:acetyl esterase